MGSSPNEVSEFFQFNLSSQLHHSHEVYSASTWNRVPKYLPWGKAQLKGKADNQTTICEPTV
jgi:hypothetical protein